MNRQTSLYLNALRFSRRDVGVCRSCLGPEVHWGTFVAGRAVHGGRRHGLLRALGLRYRLCRRASRDHAREYAVARAARILMLFPIWLGGLFAYRVATRRRLDRRLSAAPCLGSLLGYVAFHASASRIGFPVVESALLNRRTYCRTIA
jgi:hypothetical protein